MSKNARVCRKAETNKPAWLLQIKTKQNKTCRKREGQRSMRHKTLCTPEAAIYCAGSEVSFLKSRVAHSMGLLLTHLLCRMVTEESIRRRSDGGGGMIDANTISHDHAVITPPSCAHRLAAELSQSNGAIGQKAGGSGVWGRGAGPLRPPPTPGCCSRWTPSWGCRGWCCRSARCRWGRRRTAPRWRRRWSAWGPGDAAAAWTAWQTEGGLQGRGVKNVHRWNGCHPELNHNRGLKATDRYESSG